MCGRTSPIFVYFSPLGRSYWRGKLNLSNSISLLYRVGVEYRIYPNVVFIDITVNIAIDITDVTAELATAASVHCT